MFRAFILLLALMALLDGMIDAVEKIHAALPHGLVDEYLAEKYKSEGTDDGGGDRDDG